MSKQFRSLNLHQAPLFAALLIQIALPTSSPAQSANLDIAGTWYNYSYANGKTEIVTVQRQGSRLIARSDEHSYVLQRTVKGYVGAVYATASEIQKNVGIGSTPISYAMASSAAAQKSMWFKLEIEATPDRTGSINYVSLTEDFSGRSFVHNGTRVNYIAMGIQVTLTWSRKPDITPGFDFAKYIGDRKGSVDFAMKDLFSNELRPGNIYRVGIGSSGHNYVAINLVAKGIRRVPAFNLLKEKVSDIFPLGVMDGDGRSSPRPLAKGVEYMLTADRLRAILTQVGTGPLGSAIAALLPFVDNNKVRVTAITDYDITFEAIPGEHVLRGTATHGLFEDAAGDLYMYQQGRGIEAENPLRAGANILGADPLWMLFAHRLAQTLPKRPK